MKRLISLVLIFGMILSGCSMSNGRAYQKLQDALEHTFEASGGRMKIVSSSNEDEMKLQFDYCYDEKEILHYCVEQTDQNGRRLFLEYHDGKVMQRWLLGHGSLSFDETSSDFIRYTRETPYKYITLLTAMPDKKALLSLTESEADGQMVYTLSIDPENALGEQKTKEKLTERTIRYTVSPVGMVSEYWEESKYTNEKEEEKTYTLTMTLSDLGKVDEVKLPTIA